MIRKMPLQSAVWYLVLPSHLGEDHFQVQLPHAPDEGLSRVCILLYGNAKDSGSVFRGFRVYVENMDSRSKGFRVYAKDSGSMQRIQGLCLEFRV